MPEQPNQSRGAVAIIRGVLGYFLLIVVMSAAGVFGREVVNWLSGQPPTGATGQQIAPSAWQSLVIGDVSLDSPFDLSERQYLADLPAQVRGSIDSYEAAGGESATLQIAVGRTVYKSGVVVSLDGAVSGAMRGGASELGDADPRFVSSVTSFSGLPARRATYKGRTRGYPLDMEMLVVQHGQTVWQIQVIYSSDSSALAATRVLDSIRIHQKP